MTQGKSMTILMWLLAIPVGLYLLLVLLMYLYQEKLIFPATKLPATHTFSFDQPFTEHFINVNGGELNALHFHSNGGHSNNGHQENPKGLVFFLHGNAGNLDTWTTKVKFYEENNLDLFIVDYRGYGKSTGSISSVEQLHSDVRAAWDFIAPQYQEKNIPITIYGRSLGSGLATKLATEVPHQQLILVSPFSSMKSMVKQHYPYVPSSLLRYPLPTKEIIDQVPSKVSFIVGDQDFYIPLVHSEILQKLTKEPSEIYTVNGADHGDVHEFDQYWDIYKSLLL